MDTETPSSRTKSPNIKFYAAFVSVAVYLSLCAFLVFQLRGADSAEQRVQKANAKALELSAKIPLLASDAAVASQKLVSLQVELDGLNEKYAQIGEKYENAMTIVSARNQASQEYSDLMARIRISEGNHEEMQQERDELLAGLQGLRSKMRQEQQAVTLLQQQKLDLSTETGDLKAKKRELENLRKDVASLTSEKRSISDKADLLRNDVQTSHNRLILLRQQVVDEQSALTSLTIAIQNEKTNETVLTADVARLRNDVANLRSELGELDVKRSTLLALQMKIRSAQAEHDELVSSISRLSVKRKTVHDDVQKALGEQSAILADFNAMKAKVSALKSTESRLGDLDNAVSQRQAQLDELEEALVASRAELSKMMASEHSLTAREALIVERERRISAISLGQATLDELDAQISSTRNKVSKIAAQASSLQEREARVSERERQVVIREEAVKISENKVEAK